jgi:hypothetical protein
MKLGLSTFLVLLLTVLTSACGSTDTVSKTSVIGNSTTADSNSNDLTGSVLADQWGSLATNLTITANAQFTNSACNQTATMSYVIQDDLADCSSASAGCGSFHLTITDSNSQSGCYTPGIYFCSYNVMGTAPAKALTLNCGSGNTNFNEIN